METAKWGRERLLQELLMPHPLNVRLEAAQALGAAPASDPEIVQALVAARDGDPSYQVRQAAAAALQAPVHLAAAGQGAGLEVVVAAEAPLVLDSPPMDSARQPSATRPLFPWLSIWLWPRRTLRQIVDADPRYALPFLIILAGLARGLSTSTSRHLGDTIALPTVLLLAAILGPLGWLVGVYGGGLIMGTIARLLRGEAEQEEVRATLAWSSVPHIALLPAWLLMLALLGPDLFTSDMPRLEANLWLSLPLMAFGILDIAMALWSMAILLLGLAEVNRFSFWRSLATWFLTLLLVAIPILCLLLASTAR